MLGFLRRHQRILFIVIAAVIIISFSVFGSYRDGIGGQSQAEDREAFVAIDKRPVSLRWLTKMVRFLGTDGQDKLRYGGVEGPNFLNDGVIRKELLESGLAAILAENYAELIAPDLTVRQEREKRFEPYAHPQAPFLGADNVWAHFAPDIKRHLEALKDAPSFESRVKLYLAESRFPQQALKQVLYYQQGQHEWITPDPYLTRRDLSVFGYHTMEDWFGNRFLTIAAEFIVNASLVAKERGYEVTREEAWADLMHNAQESFEQNRNLVKAGNLATYVNEQLRLMGINRKEATDIWQQVMLFRRLVNDVGSIALLDAFAFEKFCEFAAEAVEVEVVSAPLLLKDFAELQAFECYREAIALDPSEDLPTAVKADLPEELLQRHYVLDVASVQKGDLRREIPIKQVWEWELSDKNWKKLSKQFPVLAASRAKTRQERFEALGALDKPTRANIDRFAQDKIVSNQRVEEALASAAVERMKVGIPLKGGNPPLPGLDSFPDKQDFTATSTDGEIFYHVVVVERSEKPELLTYLEAKEKGVLKGLVNRRLREHYKTMRLTTPFEQVRNQVAEHLFADLLKEIYNSTAATDKPSKPTGEFAAAHRFDRHLVSGVEVIDQFAVEKTSATFERNESLPFGHLDPFAMEEGTQSPVLGGKAERSFTFTVVEHKSGSPDKSHIDMAQQALAAEAQKALATGLLAEIDAKEAISVDWMEAI